MKPILMVCSAVVLYAVSNLILERKLAQIPTVSMILCSLPIMWMLALARAGSMKINGESLGMPFNAIFWFVAINAVIWFFADYCYIGAYNNGGSAMMVTTVVVMIPAVVALVKYIWFHQPPTVYHLLGWVAAITAVLLVMKGESLTS